MARPEASRASLGTSPGRSRGSDRGTVGRAGPRSAGLAAAHLDVLDRRPDQQCPAGVVCGVADHPGAEPAGASASTGPQSVSVQRPSVNGPPGAGASPANASARPRWGQPSRLTASGPPSRASSVGQVGVLVQQAEHLGAAHRRRPGTRTRSSPPARPPSPAVQTLTGADIRPRNRRSGSRSPSGGRKGCSEWMVTPSDLTPVRASSAASRSARRHPSTVCPGARGRARRADEESTRWVGWRPWCWASCRD